MIPNTPPHIDVDTTVIKNGSVWNIWGGTPLLARWTTDFDCGFETNWWYCIKDTSFDIASLPSKKRYEINKGKKNFNVREIDPVENVDGIIEVQHKAWANYPEAYRPTFDADGVRKNIQQWRSYKMFGAFSSVTDELCAYACIKEYETWADFSILKANAVNAAMVAGICEFYNNKLSQSFYICDGERNVVHQTAFQEYLIKYFGFRRAYCKLNLTYKPPMGIVVKCLYPFRSLVHKHNKTKISSKIDAVLLMEEISRTDKKLLR